MTLRLTADGDTNAWDRPYHILTRPWRRTRHIILQSPGAPCALGAGPERREPPSDLGVSASARRSPTAGQPTSERPPAALSLAHIPQQVTAGHGTARAVPVTNLGGKGYRLSNRRRREPRGPRWCASRRQDLLSTDDEHLTGTSSWLLIGHYAVVLSLHSLGARW